MHKYVLRTHLLEKPDVFFYYKGTAKEQGVPFALNTIVSFEPSEAMLFNIQTAIGLCKRLNLNKYELIEAGFSEFDFAMLEQPDALR